MEGNIDISDGYKEHNFVSEYYDNILFTSN